MRFRGRRSTRAIAAVGVLALAAAGVLVAVFAVGHGSSEPAALPTTGQFATITVTRLPVVTVGGAILSDPDPVNQEWLTSTITPLSGRNHYRLTITNTSNIGFITAFQVYPPNGVHILKIDGSSTGRCSLGGLSGFGGNQFHVVLFPNILCNRVDLKPPSCSCRGDGGSMTISFVTDGGPVTGMQARLISATPVLKVIPSFVNPGSGA
jgi:hypothetical protein